MALYRAEATKTVRYDLEFEAEDDDEAQALMDDPAYVDDLVADAQEHDDGTQVDPPVRVGD